MNTVNVHLVVWTTSDDPHSPSVYAALSKEEADKIAESWKQNGEFDEEGYSEMQDAWVISYTVTAQIPDHLANQFRIAI